MGISYEDWLKMMYMDKHIQVSDPIFQGVVKEQYYSVSARIFGIWTSEMKWCHDDVRRIVSRSLYTGKDAREAFHDACEYTVIHAGKKDLERLHNET